MHIFKIGASWFAATGCEIGIRVSVSTTEGIIDISKVVDMEITSR